MALPAGRGDAQIGMAAVAEFPSVGMAAQTCFAETHFIGFLGKVVRNVAALALADCGIAPSIQKSHVL